MEVILAAVEEEKVVRLEQEEMGGQLPMLPMVAIVANLVEVAAMVVRLATVVVMETEVMETQAPLELKENGTETLDLKALA